jgi:replicative DNA helicase
MEISGKIPQQAVDLEEAVLGAIMLETNAQIDAFSILVPEDFYRPEHQLIFRAAQTLYENSSPVDMLTIANQLKTTGHLDVVGGPYYISQLTNKVASAANIEFHSRVILQKSIARHIGDEASKIVRLSYDETYDPLQLVDDYAQSSIRVLSRTSKGKETPISEVAHEIVQEMERANQSDGITGIRTGITELDNTYSGFNGPDLIGTAARPGMGKTALMLTRVRNIAVYEKKHCVVFTLEMKKRQLLKRLICIDAQIDNQKMRKGKLHPHEWTLFNESVKRLDNGMIHIYDDAFHMRDIIAIAKKMKTKGQCDLVFIDYLTLIQSDSRESREQQVSDISRRLKLLAMDLDCPVNVLLQLNRENEKRGGDKKPMLSDLRESGAIEQDLDIAEFIHAPMYYGIKEYDDGTPTYGTAEILIRKNRHGETKDVRLMNDQSFGLFRDYEHIPMQPNNFF